MSSYRWGCLMVSNPMDATVRMPGAIALAFLALRLPSFVEPIWYSDDGTYANIGWALNHGARLYVDVWDNKPPGVYWLSGFLVAHLPIGVAMPLAATTLTLITAVGVGAIGRRLGGTRVALLAVAAYVVVGSLPFMHGTLLNAEICGATCSTLAIALVVLRREVWSAAVAGLLAGAALMFKAVFAADVVVVLGVPFLMGLAQSRADGTGMNRGEVVRRVLAIFAGVGAVVAMVAAVLARSGTLGAAITTLTQQDATYLATYSSGGASGVTALLLTLGRIAVPAGVGAVLTLRLARRGQLAAALAIWWLAWDAAGSMLSTRGFPHYVQQAEPALSVACALLVVSLWHRFATRRWGAIGALTAATVGVLIAATTLLWVPAAEVATANGHLPPWPSADGLAPSQMAAYYADGYGVMIGTVPPAQFDALFAIDLPKQRAAVAAFDAASQPGDRVFVWGYIPWVYVLSERMPAGRYVTLNSAYYADPSAQATLLSDLELHPPRAVIVDVSPAPLPLLDFLRGHGYRRIPRAVAGDDEWRLP